MYMKTKFTNNQKSGAYLGDLIPLRWRVDADGGSVDITIINNTI